jgi:Holliday junction resolvasome RuvABC endonuclease subunit
MEQKPILFSIDPGSRVTGIAVFAGDTLLDWKLIKVPTSRDPVERCLNMCSAVETVIGGILEQIEGQDRTVTLVVETPGGQNRPHSRGLVTLGMAVGMIIAYMTALGYRVVSVNAGEWTRLGGGKCKPKTVRAEKIRELYPDTYESSRDKSLDGADAIGIGTWFLGLFNEG